MLRIFRETPFPVILIILSFLCPTELSLYIANLRLPPHRVVLLLLVPFAVIRIISRPGIRVRAFDIVFLLYNIWTVGVFMHHEGAGQTANSGGTVFGGSLALESFGAYAVARAWVHNAAAFRASLMFLVSAVSVVIMIALPETLLGRHFAHDLLQEMTGYAHPRQLETRLNLTRAYATFDHPIHLGTFCATIFAMVWFISTKRMQRLRRALLIGAATLTALSSAPILCLFSQVALLVWERFTRGLRNRAAITALLIACVFIAASIFSKRSPFAWIATGLTIDSWTGYYRLLIWQHGMENVFAHPLVGLGLGDWTRPWWMASDSVDAFWLVVAMRMGIPAFLLLAAAIILLVYATARHGIRHPDPMVRNMTKAWAISLTALILVGCTVHFWNVLHAYFFFFLGLAGWIADPAAKRSNRRARPASHSHQVRKNPAGHQIRHPSGKATQPLPARRTE
ncbi:MAG TPA: hypothetical protein VMX97_07615, partial [Hyphomicrobiaceae bacterium]|nr:hypothetical protein [Hyphomicrobiaceae bacterium]